MTAQIERCLWPLASVDELAARVAASAGLGARGPAERFELSYADVTPAFSARARAACPAVVRIGAGAGALVGVMRIADDHAELVALDGTRVACPAAELAAFLRAPAETEARPGLEATVAAAGLGASVAQALCVAALGAERIAEGTRLVPARPSMFAALAVSGVGRRAAIAVAGYVAELGLYAALWQLVGAHALAAANAGGARFVPMLLALIALVVGTRLLASWTAGRLAIDVGRVLRVRLLDGVFGLDTESLRAQGIGQLLGRVVDTEALESLALGGGLTAAAGLFELATGGVVLTLGAAAGTQLALVAAWAPVVVWLARRVRRALERFTALRLAMTHDLVERMVGQRTLVIQQPPELWHRGEDAALAGYADAGRRLDAALAALAVVAPRGWLIFAIALLAPALASAGEHPGSFAASLGGALLVYGALRKLALAFPALAAARIAWRQARALLDAPTLDAPPPPAASSGQPAASAATATPAPEAVLVSGRDLGFRYPGRAAPVLAHCDFQIARGDRVLLEGPSGGGKSTLGALLAGLRVPEAGVLSLAGVEQRALGLAHWRSRIGSAPQFHENHVFSASLSFNLLLGRAWPPRREDIAEAEAILNELDLGPLLARMPSGLEQLVGESGWQLSHGEKSRLFIARSLLQPLDARVLDESFAALDPETLERALACVLRRADTLVVIAHP